MTGFATIEEALVQVRAGRPVLVLDDQTRENEGDAILAAGAAVTEWVGWMVRHTSGYLCAPMTEERADRLGLPLMWPSSQDPLRTRYTVSVDAAQGTTTGISAAERAITARTLAGPDARPGDLTRPGHILPLRARDGGVLERRGHTEAAVDLARLAGLEPVGLIGEIVDDAGACLRTPEVLALGAEEGLCVITIEQLAAWRRAHDDLRTASGTRVTAGEEAVLPTRHGAFRVTGYHDHLTGAEHVLLVPSAGIAADDGGAPWVRVHSECLTGDALGSLRCDCGEQLSRSMDQVAGHGGAVIMLRGHEGRGVGLINKIDAYHAQDGGLDTVDAQTSLGLPVDAREYGAAVAILTGLGVDSVRLLTNNPAKISALRQGGIEVEPRPLRIPPRPEDIAYLRTKRDRMGHLIDLDETGSLDARDTTAGISTAGDDEEGIA